jgi:hypothetical protein
MLTDQERRYQMAEDMKKRIPIVAAKIAMGVMCTCTL